MTATSEFVVKTRRNFQLKDAVLVVSRNSFRCIGTAGLNSGSSQIHLLHKNCMILGCSRLHVALDV